MAVSQTVEEYIEYCAHVKKLSPHTIRAYTIDLHEFVHFAKPGLNVGECDRQLFQQYVQYLFNERKLKESSVKRRMACLKAMFRWLELEEKLDENPFHKMSLKIRLPSSLPKSLSNGEMSKLIASPVKGLGYTNRAKCSELTPQKKDRSVTYFANCTTLVAIELLFATGIRVGELCSVKPDDLDIQTGTIRIHGKGDRERVVFLPHEETKELVSAYLELRKQSSPQADTLLITPRGKKADTQYIRKLIRLAGEDAGLPRRITPHMLRHTTATELLNNGVDIRFVQKLLGHQSITTTQIYTQVTDVALKRAITEGHPLGRMMGS